MDEITPWVDKSTDIKTIDKDSVLNGLEYEDVSQTQQMLYIILKKIEDMESRLDALESV